MTTLLFLSLLGCDQIQDMIAGQTDGAGSTSGEVASGSGGSDGSADAVEDEAPRGPIEIGVRTTPAPSKLMAAGTSTALPPPPVGIGPTQCNDLTDGGDVTGDCFTGVIECGQTVVGHTRGGVNKFDTKFWEKKTCWPATEQHDGGDERVYRFVAPSKGRVYFTLDTPCADLDMMVMHWSGSTCPTMDSNVDDCEAKIKPGTKREAVDVPAMEGWQYLVVVEGKGEEEGPFALTAQCGPWR